MSTRPPFRWTLRRALAVAALALGTIAMAGDPMRGHVVTLDTRELASLVDTRADHVTAAELADWIIQNRTDYRLIDTRSAGEFAEYHIPTAENLPLAELIEAGLPRNEKLVLYSDGGIHAAQAWMLLRAEGYRGVTTLFGGLEEWRDAVLYPVAPADSTPAIRAAFERTAHVARFFGGQPRVAVGETPRFAAMPKPPMPTSAVVAPSAGGARRTAAPAKKKKEGC